MMALLTTSMVLMIPLLALLLSVGSGLLMAEDEVRNGATGGLVYGLSESRLLPFDQRHHQGGLVREVLVERAYTHARDLCDAVGVETGQRLPGQNASRRRQDHLDGGEGPRLPWGLPRLQLGFIHSGECESYT
jgi:hypothetical protein